MGCFYSYHSKQCFYSSKSTVNLSITFPTSNETNFLVPKNFDSEISQLNDIILSDSMNWKNYNSFLLKMNLSFREKSQAINWFLSHHKLENSVKIENESWNSYTNATSTQNISQNSIPPSSYRNFFFDYFPFMKKHYNKNLEKTKIILEIDKVICTKKFLSNHFSLYKPYVEITIHHFSEEQTPKYLHRFEKVPEVAKIRTKKNSNKKSIEYEWNEVITHEIAEGIEAENSFFSLALYFHNKASGKDEMIGEKYIFSLSEMKNQMVTEKTLNIKENDEVICYLFFKCQMIFDVINLMLFWKNDMEIKTEVIKRIMEKANKEKTHLASIQKTKSLAFSDKKLKEDWNNMMESFHKILTSTMNLSLTLMNERKNHKETYKSNKIIDSLISQESALMVQSQSGYYDNKYCLV